MVAILDVILGAMFDLWVMWPLYGFVHDPNWFLVPQNLWIDTKIKTIK